MRHEVTAAPWSTGGAAVTLTPGHLGKVRNSSIFLQKTITVFYFLFKEEFILWSKLKKRYHSSNEITTWFLAPPPSATTFNVGIKSQAAKTNRGLNIHVF